MRSDRFHSPASVIGVLLLVVFGLGVIAFAGWILFRPSDFGSVVEVRIPVKETVKTTPLGEGAALVPQTPLASVPVEPTLPAESERGVSEQDPLPDPFPAYVELDPPFISQAPNWEWDDPVFQDACEEAAILMAQQWVERNTARVSRADAKARLLKLVVWQRDRNRYTPDLSAADTAKLFQEYTGHQTIVVKPVASVRAMQEELARGHLVIIPANGQVLANPHYTPPGPSHHMLVLKGYDLTKHQFMTQDSGTVTSGENYRFAEQVVFNAIRDYPTGFHEFFPDVRKVMLVVSR